MTNSHKKDDDSVFSKNKGDNIRFRRRQQEDREAKQEQEEALKRMQETDQRLGLYDDNPGHY